MNQKTRKIVISALMASAVCVATMIIKIPSPMKGYLNLGDCIVLLCGWLLGPVYGFAAAGLGSALADLFAGYVTYVPATFVIKGAMALVAWGFLVLMGKKSKKHFAQIVGGFVAEVVMVLGYFVFEGFLYGFAPSVVNIPANCAQGVAGLVIGVILIKLLEKAKITVD